MSDTPATILTTKNAVYFDTITHLLEETSPPVPIQARYEQVVDGTAHFADVYEFISMAADPTVIKAMLGVGLATLATKVGELIFEDFYSWLKDKLLSRVAAQAYSDASHRIGSDQPRGIILLLEPENAPFYTWTFRVQLGVVDDLVRSATDDEKPQQRSTFEWGVFAQDFTAFERDVRPFVMWLGSRHRISAGRVEAYVGAFQAPYWSVDLRVAASADGLEGDVGIMLSHTGQLLRAWQSNAPDAAHLWSEFTRDRSAYPESLSSTRTLFPRFSK